MKRTTRLPRANRVLLAALACTPLFAAAAAGEFTFVVGEVSLTKSNGTRLTPQRGTPVDPGDRLATGPNGMAQLTMVDNARLSLRPSTQFQIEAYPATKDSNDGAILNLVKGTLRTFTGLLASTNRDKFVMKTRVATVGIRGSGNILYACEGTECDESVATGAGAASGVTVNHTIEGSHSISNALTDKPGVPAQQGGAGTIITGPGQTVLVLGTEPPRYIPTPRFISDVATSMTGAKAAELKAAAAEESRNFSPNDSSALPPSQQTTTTQVGNNGLGFANDIEAVVADRDPAQLRDIVITAGSPFLGQATQAQVEQVGAEFHGYTAYAGSQSGVAPSVVGGTFRDANTVAVSGGSIVMGRYENASIGFFGAGSVTQVPGSVHFINGPSGYPAYLADVLTGTAVYTLAAATAPTNQLNMAGSVTSATLNANFSDRTLALQVALGIAGTGGGQWNLAATNVPISLNAFFGSTSNNLTITNGNGQSSRSNTLLTGSFEGSFVGGGLNGAILGYGISDRTQSTANFVSGVAALTGPAQNGASDYREGRISDPTGSLQDFVRSYATTDRPDEVVSDTQGRVTAFTAPLQALGGHASYTLGSATVVESGIDAETGLVWGRWGGGTVNVTRGGSTQNINLAGTSLHYIFTASQNTPVSLPLTGTAVYSVIGSTHPTDGSGHVGNLNSATLNANFSNRTVDAAVNISINNQTWNGAANGMAIYRDMYFSAYSGAPIAGVPNPVPLAISCTPNCGVGAAGSIDGFFAGRTGQRAGMMYNLGGNQGAVAFGRPGGP